MKNMNRGFGKGSRKPVRTHRSHMERLENRQLMSASLTINNPLLVFNAVKGSSVSPTQSITFTDTGDATMTFGSSAFSLARLDVLIISCIDFEVSRTQGVRPRFSAHEGS